MTSKTEVKTCIYTSKVEQECQLFQRGKTKTSCKFKLGRGKCGRELEEEEEEEEDD